MSSQWPKSGPNNVPSYQLSGIPFVTTSVPLEVQGPRVGGSGTSANPIKVKFPYVTRFFTINNTGPNALRVAFSKSGSFGPLERTTRGGIKGTDPAHDHRNYFLIPTASGTAGWSGVNIVTFEARCKELYFMSNTSGSAPGPAQATSFSLFAGLTTIPATQFPTLTGSQNGTLAFEGIG